MAGHSANCVATSLLSSTMKAAVKGMTDRTRRLWERTCEISQDAIL